MPARTVVFRGTEPAELDLIEGRLEVEGLRPLRLGRAHAALAGGGNSAFEQLITVPNECCAAALSLLELGAAAVDEAELERQAVAAEPLEAWESLPTRAPSVADPDGSRPRGGFPIPVVAVT